jgi:hypothetical protein
MKTGSKSLTRKDYMTKELEVRKAWEDDTMKGADYVKNFVGHLMKERAQLYGTIIHLMLTNKLDVMEFPEIETFKQYGKDYYVVFEQEEGIQNFRAKLLKQEKDEQ